MVDLSTTDPNDYYVALPQGNGDAGISRFDISQIVGIGPESDSSSGFNLYPNPATDFLTLLLDEPAAEGTAIEVVDVSGRIVSSQQIDPMKQTYSIDISHLTVGMYFVRFISVNGTSSQKFIKNN